MTTYKSIRNLSACVEKRGRVGMGGWLQFGRGEMGWGRRRRNRGRESRQSGYILAFTDGITNKNVMSVIPSVSPSVTMSRHCMKILV